MDYKHYERDQDSAIQKKYVITENNALTYSIYDELPDFEKESEQQQSGPDLSGRRNSEMY